LHIVISFLTHTDHVFLGLPRFLVPGTPNRVMELMQEVAQAQEIFRTAPATRKAVQLVLVPVKMWEDIVEGTFYMPRQT